VRKSDEAYSKQKLKKVLSEQRRAPDGKNFRFWNMRTNTDSDNKYNEGFSHINWNIRPSDVKHRPSDVKRSTSSK